MNTSAEKDRKIPIDQMEMTPFHWKLTLFSMGGPICDGYILCIIAVVLPYIVGDFQLDAMMTGLVGAATLVGIFLGGLIFGYLTDKFGRKKMYILDLMAFVVLSLLQLFVTDVWQLIALRLLSGVAVGADYPIATSLLAEFTPQKKRGTLLSLLVAGWSLGAMLAYLVGFLLTTYAAEFSAEYWRWILASSAVPAFIVLIKRLGTPESPRWLIKKGRRDEAERIVKELFGSEVTLSNESEEQQSTQKHTRFKDIFASGYGRRTLFVSLFWIMQTIPAFALNTYAPQILESFHMTGPGGEWLGAILIAAFTLIGIIPGMFLVNSIGRRPLVMWPFLLSGITLLAIGLWADGPAFYIISLFIVFSLLTGACNVLQWIYPNELFPTEIRATAVGFGSAMSRIGAAAGTFLLPMSIQTLGIGPTVIIAAGFCFIGFIVSWLMAPETAGKSLEETSQL